MEYAEYTGSLSFVETEEERVVRSKAHVRECLVPALECRCGEGNSLNEANERIVDFDQNEFYSVYRQFC